MKEECEKVGVVVFDFGSGVVRVSFDECVFEVIGEW